MDNREEVPPEDAVEDEEHNGILFFFRTHIDLCDYYSDIDYDRFDHQTDLVFLVWKTVIHEDTT